MECPCPLPLDSGYDTLLKHQCVHQSGSSTKLWCPKFLSGFHYLGMIEYITGHVTKFSLQLPSFTHPDIGSSLPLILCLVFLMTCPHLKLCKDVTHYESPQWHIKDTPVTQQIPRVFKALSQEPDTLFIMPHHVN